MELHIPSDVLRIKPDFYKKQKQLVRYYQEDIFS